MARANLPGESNTATAENPRGYTRRPEVEAEIRALPQTAGPALREAACAAEHAETLVFSVRALVRAGEASAAEVVLDQLLRRCEKLVAGHLKNLLRNAQDREDAAADVAVRLWQEVNDLSPQKAFWEFNFARKLKLCCIDAAQAVWRRTRHERPFDRAQEGQDDAPDEAASLAAPVDFDTSLLVSEAMDQLDGVVRQAVWLKIHGFQEKSNDPSEQTISKLLGVTDRSVRNYLTRGWTILRAWHGEVSR